MKLSVVIITFNEERNIERCLKSIAEIADDVVVVDSFSTDKTEEICKKRSVNFVKKKWEGYSATKNFANTLAKHDWIFSIDADEEVSEELKNSILEKKKNISTSFRINRKANYCGKWISHGGWHPDYKVRFFDRMKTKWTGTIHERLNVEDEKKIPVLKGDLHHYTYYSVEEHLKRMEHYTALSAKELFEKKMKPNYAKMLFSPFAKFLRDYFFRLGFLDGKAGFTIAFVSAKASFLKHYKHLKMT